MAKKEIFYQGLDSLPVIIEDNSSTSPDYFRVTNLPSQFNAGLNEFKFKGNASVFPEGAEILIEILDINGVPINYTVDVDLESEERSAIVTIYINQDTAPGNGSIILCSTITQSADGKFLDDSDINLRWQVPIYIDPSKRNDAEIIFNEIPEVVVSSNYSRVSEIEYVDFSLGAGYKNKEQIQTVKLTRLGAGPSAKYYYNNNTPVIILNEFVFTNPVSPQRGFVTSSINAIINISSSYIVNLSPTTSSTNIIKNQVSSSISLFTGSFIFSQSFASPGTGSHIAYLKDPISYPINNSNNRYYPKTAEFSDINITYTLSKKPDNVYTFENKTQNSYNSVNVNFTKLTPLIGTIAKIRSYYKSSGVNEYILLNETDITEFDTEFGFNTGSLNTTFAVPTVHKNEKIDFKFEYISPVGFVSKQYTEIKNITFVGGNSYIAGEDNLITGSLFVASSTGSGVQISGKNKSAMIRSIGYEGFAKAKAGTSPGGFVIYSGSIQPILNSSEVYSGVGIELYANTASYFKYTTSGSGLLDIRTDNFFLGSNRQFISGANGNIEISSSNFHLSPNGDVNMSGDINANTGIFKDVNIIGTIATSNAGVNYLLEPWITGSSYITSASLGKLAKLPLQFTNAGADPFGNQMQKFKFGSYYWTGSCINYTYNYETNISTPTSSISFTSSISSITGSSFSTYSEGITPVIFDYSAIGDTIQYPNSGAPLTFAKWGRLAGYDGHEYGIDANGNYVTSSIDSVIFNVVTGSVPYTVSILSELLNVDDINFYDAASNPTPVQLQMQAKFINNTPDWLYAYKNGIAGPKMYDCKFTIDIYNGNDVLLLSDSRMQDSEFDWMDFNIPLTALLLKTKTVIDLGMGNAYYSNKFRIKLSWQVVKHTLPLGYTEGTSPKQIRITEARIVHVPTAIGLRASSINFTDSYLASMNNGTAVQGNLIPVDDSLYDLGSSDQNPLLGDNLINFTSTDSQKRWNNIYGKFLSADNAISIGNSIILQPTGSIANGNISITAGKYSHAEGYNTTTGIKTEVNNGTINTYNFTLVPGDYLAMVQLAPATATSNNISNRYITGTLDIVTFGTGSNLYGIQDTVICTSASYITKTVGPPFQTAVATKFHLEYYDSNEILQPYTKDIYYIMQANATSGLYAHAEGYETAATGISSHTEGYFTIASGEGSHTEGYLTIASGSYSHAEGDRSLAQEEFSHAEGSSTVAKGYAAHSEGEYSIASGSGAHAEGYLTQAIGGNSHAEGFITKAIGTGTHAEGYSTQARGDYSHTEGLDTVASGSYQHVQGQYNQSSSAQSAFIVGNGTSDIARSNLIFAAGSEVQITGSLKVTQNIQGSTAYFAVNGATSDPYGPVSVTNTTASNWTYFAMTRQAQMPVGIGITTNNQMWMGQAAYASSPTASTMSTSWLTLNATAATFPGTVTINDMLVLKPVTTTPVRATTATGSIIMSGSGGSNIRLYIFTGAGPLAGWSQILTS